MKNQLKKLCTPAKIYLALSIFACILALFNGVPILAVITNLFFVFIWTYILAWLCKVGYEGISWFLVLLPYIILLLGIFGIVNMAKNIKNIINI